MKILITSFTFPPAENGVAHVAAAHAAGLVCRGHQVTIATGYDAARTPASFLPGIDVHQFRVSGQGSLHSPHKGDVEQYKQFVAAYTGDVVMLHGWATWATNLALKAKFRKVKSVLVSHGFPPLDQINSARSLVRRISFAPYRFRAPEMLRSFDWIVFLTDQSDGDRFYDRLLVHNVGLTNFNVIPNGADLAAHDADLPDFRRRFAIDTTHLVLCVSNFQPGKNQAAVLRAFAAANLPDATLVLIGSGETEYLHYLQGLAGSLQAKHAFGKVRFLMGLGRNEILAAYRAADVFAFASLTEVQPLVILDAMASSTPFVSTPVGCLRDFAGGILVADEETMAQELKRLLQTPQLRQELGAAGRLACEDRYNWYTVIDQYDALLKQLVA